MAASAEFVTQITRVQRQLHAFILSVVWDMAEADDVLQETNLVLWQKAAEFDSSRDFLPWALRFAQFQALAWLKRRQRQQAKFDDTLAGLMADEAASEDQAFEARRMALADCLQKLSAEQRELVMRRYEPGASVNGIARRARPRPRRFPTGCGGFATPCCCASRGQSRRRASHDGIWHHGSLAEPLQPDR